MSVYMLVPCVCKFNGHLHFLGVQKSQTVLSSGFVSYILTIHPHTPKETEFTTDYTFFFSVFKDESSRAFHIAMETQDLSC